MVETGKLKRVELNKVWPNEAQDFTPWLADNLCELGKELGLDLDFRGREVQLFVPFLVKPPVICLKVPATERLVSNTVQSAKSTILPMRLPNKSSYIFSR